MVALLLTGASGYIGGDILAALVALQIPTLEIFCLVRNDSHSSAVSSLGCIPVKFDLDDAEAIKKTVLDHGSELI